jgi:hypothetical protein
VAAFVGAAEFDTACDCVGDAGGGVALLVLPPLPAVAVAAGTKVVVETSLTVVVGPFGCAADTAVLVTGGAAVVVTGALVGAAHDEETAPWA